MCEGTDEAAAFTATSGEAENRTGQLAGTTTRSEAGSAPQTPQEMSAFQRFDLEFGLALDVHYHRSRQMFLSAAHRWAMFMSIIFGTAAAGDFLKPAVAGIFVAAAAAADLCFDFSGRAQIHADYVRRAHEIARDLHAGAPQGDLMPRYFELSATEGPLYKTVQEGAFNEATLSLGRDPAAMIKIGRLRWLLRHFLPG